VNDLGGKTILERAAEKGEAISFSIELEGGDTVGDERKGYLDSRQLRRLSKNKAKYGKGRGSVSGKKEPHIQKTLPAERGWGTCRWKPRLGEEKSKLGSIFKEEGSARGE